MLEGPLLFTELALGISHFDAASGAVGIGAAYKGLYVKP